MDRRLKIAVALIGIGTALLVAPLIFGLATPGETAGAFLRAIVTALMVLATFTLLDRVIR